MQTQKKRAIAISVVLVSLGTLFPASAGAWLIIPVPRRFPGSACVKVGTDGVAAFTVDGAIYNDTPNGGDLLEVDCPVVANRGPTADGSQNVWYIDNSTAAITCHYWSEDNDSSAFTASSANSNRDDNIYAAMNFSVTTLSEGFTHFRCYIPSRDASGNASYIVGYEGW